MSDELISFDTAILAREKGFKSKSRYYDGSGELVETPNVPENDYRHTNNMMQRFRYEAPTQTTLQKWLNEEIGFIVLPTYHYWEKCFKVDICGQFSSDVISGIDFSKEFDKYEEALEYGLLEALKLM